MALPVVTVASGGLPVVEAAIGLPVTEATNLRGMPVTKVTGGKPGLAVVYVSATGGQAATTWNPADKSAIITLSGGNLVVGTTGGTDAAVRSIKSQTATKIYYEITWATNSFGADTSCGICTGAASLTMGANSIGACLIYANGGQMWFNGTDLATLIGTAAVNDVYCMAIDLVNQRFWARRNGGNWNNSGTANPATNTGGVNISALFAATNAFAVVTANQILNPLATANFGATAFAQTMPAGFSAWG
jgi:hypothetical protein